MNIIHQNGTDVTIGTRSAPQRNLATRGKEMKAQNAVRTFRCSPEDVMLQIRLASQFVNATLTLEEAKFVGESLIAAATEG